MSGEKFELSMLERVKWPFLQPNIDTLRVEMRDAKSTLMLMLQVASLALNKRMFDASLSTSEHEDYVRTIVALELQRREEQEKPKHNLEPDDDPQSSSWAKASKIILQEPTYLAKAHQTDIYKAYGILVVALERTDQEHREPRLS